MLNTSLSKFKSRYKSKINQVLYYSIKTNGIKEIENLINNFLIEKDSFVFEWVEKGFIKGRYTIFGKNPDKIWEFNNNKCRLFFNNQIKILSTGFSNIVIIDDNIKSLFVTPTGI